MCKNCIYYGEIERNFCSLTMNYVCGYNTCDNFKEYKIFIIKEIDNMNKITGTIINGFKVLEVRKDDVVKVKHLETGKISYEHLGDLRKGKIKVK